MGGLFTTASSENQSEVMSSSLSDSNDYTDSTKLEEVNFNAFTNNIFCQLFSVKDIVLADDIRELKTSMLKCFSQLNMQTLRLDGFGPNFPGGAIAFLTQITVMHPFVFSRLTLLDLSQQFQSLSLLLQLFSSADSDLTVSRFPHLKFLAIRPIKDNNSNLKPHTSSYSSSSSSFSDEFGPVPLPCLSTCILHLSFDVFCDTQRFRSLICVIQGAETLTISQRFCRRKLSKKGFRTHAEDWSFPNLRYLQIPPWEKLIQVLSTGRSETPSRFPSLQRVCIQLCDQWVHIHPLNRLSQLLPGIEVSLRGFGQTCLEEATSRQQGETDAETQQDALLLGTNSTSSWWPHLDSTTTTTSLEIALCPGTMSQTPECRLSLPLAQLLQTNFGKLEKLTFSVLFAVEKPDYYADFHEVISRLSRFYSLHLLPLLACGADRLESVTLSTEIWIASGIKEELETPGRCFNSVKSLSLLRLARNKHRSLAFPAELQYPFAKAVVYARGLERLCHLFPSLQSLTLHTEPAFCLDVVQPLAALCPRLSRLCIFHLAITGPYMLKPLKVLISTLPLEVLLLHVSSLSMRDYVALVEALTSPSLRYVFLYAGEGERPSLGELRNMALAMPRLRWLLIYVENQKTCFTAQGTSGVSEEDQPTLTEEYCETFEHLFTCFPQLYGVFWEEELRCRCRYPYWLPGYTEEPAFDGRVCNLNKI